ncbi:TetR/AcrR family transcriptional regulator [Rhizobium sp. P40RR-XXII]|uniref:TetR/AcrR family transcriptional regulator n=1 Tax=Rhizobium sp. P40RR-XXII TaxID=2726739 RepID=UPI001456460B|nr:TetR/AcrR family transcriptional regulator [Rhizobium sp. P40RR-XXII]NLS20697.1 TetR/AcrR family transcriptional regulator [Rhizobium sp. P40RR-XXII]
MKEVEKIDERETIDLILDQAEALIRRIGRKKTNVEDIAEKLGMSRANVYRFFPTRAAIDRGVYARQANQSLSAALAISETFSLPSAKLVTLLEHLHKRVRDDATHAPNVHALSVAAHLEDWPETRQYVQRLREAVEHILRDVPNSSRIVLDRAGTAQAVVEAMMSFIHPVLVEQRLQGNQKAGSALRLQTAFVLRALRIEH